jgi:hypothetical protein
MSELTMIFIPVFDGMQRYQFKSIRVDFPEQILINEKDPAPHYIVRASIHAHNKPWFFAKEHANSYIPISCYWACWCATNRVNRLTNEATLVCIVSSIWVYTKLICFSFFTRPFFFLAAAWCPLVEIFSNKVPNLRASLNLTPYSPVFWNKDWDRIYSKHGTSFPFFFSFPLSISRWFCPSCPWWLIASDHDSSHQTEQNCLPQPAACSSPMWPRTACSLPSCPRVRLAAACRLFRMKLIDCLENELLFSIDLIIFLLLVTGNW